MAYVTADQPLTAQDAQPQDTARKDRGSPQVSVRIEPARALLDLRLREAWAYRELLYFFVWRDVKVRYKQTAIGVAWVVLQPLLSMGVFTLFFGRLAKLPWGGLPFPLFYFAALAPWSDFSTAFVSAPNVVVLYLRIFLSVYCPRLIWSLCSVVM